MALGRIKPYLIDATGASANQVLTYNVATGFVSFENASGGSGSSFATADDSNVTFQAGNVLPAANAVYSLGGPDLYWKDIYVSDGTIILGNTSISVDESANVVFTNRVTDQPAKIAVDEIVLGRGANKKRIKLDDNDTSKIRFGDARIDSTDDKDINSELDNVSANVDLVQSNVSSLPDSAANDYATYTTLSSTLLPLAGGTMSGDINLDNNDLININYLSFNDPGVGEGIRWTGGNGWQIFESPDNMTNAGGSLQFTTGTSTSDRMMTIDTNGNLGLPTGRLTQISDDPLRIRSSTNASPAKIEFSDLSTGGAYNQAGTISYTHSDAASTSAGISGANEVFTIEGTETVTGIKLDGRLLVTGTSEFQGDANFGSNKIYYANMFSTEADLPSASTYHGMFAHVHGTGAGYFAHGGNWIRLANHGDLTVDNNTWVNANDHSTYTTLSALIDTVQDNVGSGGGTDNNAWVNANDYATYTTVTANTYDTYTTLSGLIDTVQDNVGSGGGSGSSGGSGGTAISDTFTTVATGNTFTLSESVSDANSIIVSFQGINQIPNDDYVVSGTTLTLNNTDPITAGLKLEVRHLKLLTVTNTDAIIATTTSAQTVFTSPFNTNDPNDIIVTVDGLMQRPTTDYTVSGTSVTFGSAPPVGTSVMVRHAAVTANNSSGSSVSWTWEEQSSDFTAEVSYRYFIDSSSAAVTATLPASATLGDEIRFIDATGSANVNSITISRNSHKIQGIAEDLTISTHRAAFGLVYYNSTHGWLMMEV